MINFALLSTESSDLVSPNNWSSTQGMIGQLFLVVLAFALVLLLAYYATKFLARSGIKKGKIMETLESMFINQTSSVRLVRVGGKFFLIGVTKDKITFLTEIEEEQIDTNYAAQGFQAQPLSSLFNKLGLKSPNSGRNRNTDEDDDE